MGEVDALKETLAVAQMDKASAEAELDATSNKRPDTTEADSLRKELAALKESHATELAAAKEDSTKVVEEHTATKESLTSAAEELEAHKAATEAKSKAAEHDFSDMHDALTQLVEEANNKNLALEARMKEVEANLKVKEAELAEAEVST